MLRAAVISIAFIITIVVIIIIIITIIIYRVIALRARIVIAGFWYQRWYVIINTIIIICVIISSIIIYIFIKAGCVSQGYISLHEGFCDISGGDISVRGCLLYGRKVKYPTNELHIMAAVVMVRNGELIAGIAVTTNILCCPLV